MLKPKHIAVAGAGPAGIAATIALLQAGFSVTLIEKTNLETFRAGEHLGAEAIPVLRQLGVSQHLWANHHLKCTEVRSVWGSTEVYENASVFNPYGDGWILSRPGFDRQLTTHAKAQGATVLTNTTLAHAKRQAHNWLLQLKQPQQDMALEVDFVVDATGRNATIAKLLGSKTIDYDKLVGIVGFVPGEAGSDYTRLLIETCADGWWYSAQLHNGQLVATYMTDADLLARSPHTPAELWLARLEASVHTKTRFDKSIKDLKVHVKSARSRQLEQVAGKNWLATGDAAMSYDPLSSQGIYKGLRWGIRAAEAITQYFESNQNASPLLNYENEVKATFQEYQEVKAHYYRQEQRWTNHPFWQRRHCPLPHEVPIYLPPKTLLRVTPGVVPAEVQTKLCDKAPTIHLSTLVQLAADTHTAHELVLKYKTKYKTDQLDQAIIVAVQYLLESNFLEVSTVETKFVNS